MSIKIAINGFGRIGRNVLRCIFQDKECRDFEVSAINDLTDPKTLAHLFKYDSIQGLNNARVEFGGDSLIVNDKPIRILSERDPAQLPWKDLGIDVVIESQDFLPIAKERKSTFKPARKR